MRVDQKILDALIGLLSDGKPVNIHSLSCRAGIDRQSIYYRINKSKKFFSCEVL